MSDGGQPQPPAEATTDEQASVSTGAGEQKAFGSPLAADDEPAFASETEATAYWNGVTHGLRCAIGEIRRCPGGIHPSTGLRPVPLPAASRQGG